MAAASAGASSNVALSIAITDPAYPPLLREIHDPPAVLHVRGDTAALQRPMVAVVGSRRASAAGLKLAQRLARSLGEAGLQVCSGLALGIDGAAHRGALTTNAGTVAVMATGIDRVYPPRHADLALDVASNGCLVTEFEAATPPRRGNFPRRNRIISGMSLGVVVVEAAVASGSLITARSALEQGREVFALPWSPLHPGGSGCLQLLRDGAKMVLSIEDILEEVGALYRVATASDTRSPSAGSGSGIEALLGYEPVGLDELVAASGRSAEEVLVELSELEIRGRLTRVAGRYMRSG